MKKSVKISLYVVGAILSVTIIIFFFNNYAENEIQKSLDENLEKLGGSYNKINVNLLGRKVSISEAEFKVSGKNLKVKNIEVTEIGLWEYIVNKNISVGELIITQPQVKIYQSQNTESDSIKTSPDKEKHFKKQIFLEKVSVLGGALNIYEQDSLRTKLFFKLKEVILEDVNINSKTLREKVPFQYSLSRLTSDSVYYNLSDLHVLMLEDFNLQNNKLSVTNLKIKAKFNKVAHQKHTPVERDWYDLNIGSLLLSDLTWNFQNDSLKFQNSYTEISEVNFEIYRDKLLPDDLTRKPMYSEMLRDLPVKLKLDSIKVKNMFLKYEERIDASRKPGLVDFDNINASIYNVVNIGMNKADFPKTQIKARSKFMNEATLNLDWVFDISNKYDQFQVSGNMYSLTGDGMNNFLKPAMNIEASGNITSMYFNFAGDEANATGDMRLDYDKFKVEVLRKNGEKKNKFLTALANLVVKNDGTNKEANIKSIEVERDVTKSFWNYLWKCIEKGALKTFL